MRVLCMQNVIAWSLAMSAFCNLLSAAETNDWPHWRGPNRNDCVPSESGWDGKQWKLKEAWRVQVGDGSSSPLVIGNRIFTMGWRDGRDQVLCLDMNSGKQLWSTDYACPRYGRRATGDQGIYSGVSSTPEYDTATGYLYSLSTDGDLHCWETNANGAKVWNLNLYDRFDIPQRPRVGRSGRRDYGFTSSPLVYRDWILVEVGSKEGNLLAFDKRTGKLAWSSESKSPAGHNGGPTPITIEGIPCVALHTHDGLLVIRLDGANAGKTVATYEWITSFANNIATPAVHKNSVILSSAYNQYRTARIDITLSGAKKVWEIDQASKVCSPVIHDGNVYWAWRKFYCVDFETGAMRWQGGRVGDQASVVATKDHRLVAWANRGDLLLVDSAKHSPKTYRQLASKQVLRRTDAWPHIVIAQNRFLCRDRSGTLVCFAINP